MDALTHAIEGYITKGHCVISDMFHLEAIKLISQSLRGAVQNTPEGREGMALGQYIAGMGFSNVGLGIVHSMAHGLSALYDTPMVWPAPSCCRWVWVQQERCRRTLPCRGQGHGRYGHRRDERRGSR